MLNAGRSGASHCEYYCYGTLLVLFEPDEQDYYVERYETNDKAIQIFELLITRKI